MKKLFFFLIIFFMFIITPNAACSYKEQKEIAVLASNIKVTYQFIMPEVVKQCDEGYTSGDSCTTTSEPNHYKIGILNIPNNVSILVSSAALDKPITVTNSNENLSNYYFTTSSVYDTYEYSFIVTGNTRTCSEYKARTIRMTTPRYNHYSTYEECVGYEEFALCKQFYNYNVDYDEFQRRLKEYKESLKEQTTEPQKEEIKDKEELSILSVAINFILQYKIYFIIGGSIIIVSTLAIIIRIRKKRVI